MPILLLLFLYPLFLKSISLLFSHAINCRSFLSDLSFIWRVTCVNCACTFINLPQSKVRLIQKGNIIIYPVHFDFKGIISVLAETNRPKLFWKFLFFFSSAPWHFPFRTKEVMQQVRVHQQHGESWVICWASERDPEINAQLTSVLWLGEAEGAFKVLCCRSPFSCQTEQSGENPTPHFPTPGTRSMILLNIKIQLCVPCLVAGCEKQRTECLCRVVKFIGPGKVTGQNM